MDFHINEPTHYFATFLENAGASGNTLPVLPATYQAKNIRGQWKRAFASTIMVGAGGAEDIVGALVFRCQDQPKFLPSMCTAGLSAWLCHRDKLAK
jgi:hypothetical protein